MRTMIFETAPSFVFQSITGVFTTLAGLGKIHTDRVWDLVNADIEEEHQKLETENYRTIHHLSTNEAKLRDSKHLALGNERINMSFVSKLIKLIR